MISSGIDIYEMYYLEAYGNCFAPSVFQWRHEGGLQGFQ